MGMKILLLLALCAVVAAAPKSENHGVVVADSSADVLPGSRNFLVNALIRQLFAFIRGIIQNGSGLLGLPPLDPLNLEHFHLVLPSGLIKMPFTVYQYTVSSLKVTCKKPKVIISLDLELQNILMSGIGGFKVHKSDLQLSELSFDIDIEVPNLDLSTELYDLTGDLLTAIPIFGKGKARFVVDQFRLKAKLYLKQSDNEKSVIIDRIEGASFDLPSLKSQIEGAIGGGDIDPIVNAVVEDVIVGYVNRFRGAISKFAAQTVISVGNPILERLDTWRFIAPLLPK